jgi:predicted 2-oxoglutarate/Fe(II)-dependent dioxygenase YbiX
MEGDADHHPPPAAAVKKEECAAASPDSADVVDEIMVASADTAPAPDAAPASSPAGDDEDADEEVEEVVVEEEEEEEAAAWEEQLAEALSQVGQPGAFAFSGAVDNVPAFAPAVTVEGLGRLVLPLCAEQAAALRAAAEPAPFGRGSETVLDERVRRARQVPAARVSVAPAAWAAALARTVARAAAALGIRDSDALGVTATLDKLVLYEPGGHFAPHKDTEKAPGMFGTLVVQLPCAGGHAGGELVVRHQGRRVRVDFAASSTAGGVFPCAAFFARDCTHELTPLTAGMRLALLYNLVRTTPGAPPAPADGAAADAALAAAAAAWAAAGAGARARIALPLEHAYTPASVSFTALKGRDAFLARALLACPALDVRLALLHKTQTGTPSCDGDVDGEEVTTVKWVAPPGREALALDDVDDEDLLEGDEALRGLFEEDAEPDEREYEGYQGNYAGTLTFTYHSAVAVVWLAARTRDVATLASLDGAVARLEAAPAAPAAAALLGDVCATAAKEPRKLSAALVARLLALLPRMQQQENAAAARRAGVQMLDALAHGDVRLDAGAAAAVGAFVAANAGDESTADALRRLARRAAAADVRAAAALAAALAGTPAAQAEVLAALTALVHDATAFAKLPAAALPDLLQALLGAPRCEAAPLEETRQLGLRVIAALSAAHGIPSAAVASALAAHVNRAAEACAATHDALLALVRAHAAAQLQECAALARAATAPRPRAALVAALAALADDATALREPHVTALCTLLLSEPGRDGADAARLLAALAASPHGIASASVAAAVADCACRMACGQLDAAVAALLRAHARRQLPAAVALVRALAPPRSPPLFAAALAAAALAPPPRRRQILSERTSAPKRVTTAPDVRFRQPWRRTEARVHNPSRTARPRLRQPSDVRVRPSHSFFSVPRGFCTA